MAKIRYSLVAAVTAASLVLTACGNGESSSSNETTAANGTTTITVEDNFGTEEIAQPIERVAITDNRSFEILDDWGIVPVAVPKSLVPATVPDYKDNADIVDLGNHREPNLEALAAAQPDLVVNGQRFTQYREDIVKLVPEAAVVDFSPRDDKPLDEELKRQATELGVIFDKEAEADKLVADFDAALERAKAAYDPTKKVMAVNVSGGTIGFIAPGIGRTYGPIFDLLNLTPALEVDDASQNHQGDDISVEAIAAANPDWILVLDRDGGTSSRNEPGYIAATDVIEGSEPLKNVVAIQEGNVVYAPQDTYTNENIITYTEILNDIADAFEAQNN